MTAEFCLDTSVFINPWRKMWPPDLIPDYWAGVAELNSRGVVIVSDEVRRELEQKDDELHAWAKTSITTWHPVSTEIQHFVREIMDRWGRLVDHRPGSGADPFVIATARMTGTIVVTDEGIGSETRPKIPWVCKELGLDCISPLEFVRRTRILGSASA